VSDKKKWLKGAFGNPSTQTGYARTEVGSVADKRQWLKDAFPQKTSAALSEIVTRDDDKRARVKKAFAARRASRQSLEREEEAVKKSRFQKRSTEKKPKNVAPHVETKEKEEAVRSEPLRSTETIALDTEKVSPAQKEEFGFAALRDRVVKRSKENGNPVNVVTKVHLRKSKFERWQKELGKGTDPHGLLKAAWSEDASVEGKPSTSSYSKGYIEDIAPKKSFDELP